MGIEYRKLSEKELDVFIEMRINQLREEGARADIDLKPALLDYYMRHMKDGTFVSWIAVDGDRIIGTSGMSFVEKPPYFGCSSGKIGLLSSMFTNPDYTSELAEEIQQLRERKNEIETAKSERRRDEDRVAALRESVEKAKDKVLAYDEQLVRNFIEEIRVFPDKLTITVKGGAKEDIAI